MTLGDQLPLHRLVPWQPFRLDALGLVTLLGAEEVSRAIGGLQHSTVTEYLPLLGAYMVAANRFTEPLPGYMGYNITDGIIPPSLNGSFTRWLDNHIYSGSRREDNTVIVNWELAPEADVRTSWRKQFLPLVIGISLNSALLVMAILMADWYGIANSVSLILSVVVRWFLLRQNQSQLGKLAKGARDKIKAGKPEQLEEKRIIVVPPSSSKVVVNKLQGALIPCFVAPLAKPQEQSYRFTRFVGWLAFGIQVLCIGQSSLVAQIMTVVLMFSSTVGAIYRVGCDEREFGHFLMAKSSSSKQQRRDCFAELDPTDDEELALRRWSLLPLEVTNQTAFYLDYRRRKAEHLATTKSGAIVSQGAPGRHDSANPAEWRQTGPVLV